MTALFIGRFQPFHLGHLDALQQIANDKNVSKISIGIGSSQYSGTDENPYSFEQRKKMIEFACENNIKKNYKIIAIPDIHNDKKWVAHVEKIVGQFDVVYTGNNWIKKLFKKAGARVKPIDIKIKISGTKLRKMIKENNPKWKKYIPNPDPL